MNYNLDYLIVFVLGVLVGLAISVYTTFLPSLKQIKLSELKEVVATVFRQRYRVVCEVNVTQNHTFYTIEALTFFGWHCVGLAYYDKFTAINKCIYLNTPLKINRNVVYPEASNNTGGVRESRT